LLHDIKLRKSKWTNCEWCQLGNTTNYMEHSPWEANSQLS